MNPQDMIHQALVEELGIGGLPPQVQADAIATAGGPILQAVMIDMLEKMPQDKRAEFQKALEAGDKAQIVELITANIPNSSVFIEQSVSKAIAEFKSLRST